MTDKPMKMGTKVVHAGVEPEVISGAIMTPIYQTSTFAQISPGQNKVGYTYSRGANPTRDALQKSIATLEQGDFCLCFSSGMGAVDTVIKLLKTGDEVIASADLYGGTYRMFKHVFEAYQITFHFVDFSETSNITSLINDRTQLLWFETPSNPLMQIIDIEACVAIAKKNNILVAVDNTFASPCLQTPLTLGADIVMQSVTKYISGHSDLIMGALVVKEKTLYDRLKFIQNSCGPVPSPHDCFLALRGIKTLFLRMQQHCQNGERITHFLNEHAKVKQVYWPGLPTHPNHKIAVKQMKGFGGMISFTLHNDQVDQALTVMKHTKLFTLAESLGGVESLINHPASMTHASVPKAIRIQNGLSDSLIRLSVGIEDADDLIDDLKEALQSTV